MTKLFITILSSLLLANAAWAHMAENNSLSNNALEINANGTRNLPPANTKLESHYTHKSEQNNSLIRGALAKQGVGMNLRINSESEVSYERYPYTKSDQRNSLFRGILSK
jgi:hypothetical protein